MERPVGIPTLYSESRQADVRSASGRVPDRHDARHHHDDGPRADGPAVPRDRHRRRLRPLSHHKEMEDVIALVEQIDLFQAKLFAYFVEKMRNTKDGDGSLLDHWIILDR